MPMLCRRHLRAPAALLGGVELDLPALAGGLAALPDALAAHLSLSSATAAHTAAAALENEQLTALLSLGDAAVQRFAELAEAAAVSAGDAAAAAGDGAATKPDNGWLQPLVTALETVLSFIEVWVGGWVGGWGGWGGWGGGGGAPEMCPCLSSGAAAPISLLHMHLLTCKRPRPRHTPTLTHPLPLSHLSCRTA